MSVSCLLNQSRDSTASLWIYAGQFNFKLNSAAGWRTWPVLAFRCWQGRNDGNVKVQIIMDFHLWPRVSPQSLFFFLFFFFWGTSSLQAGKLWIFPSFIENEKSKNVSFLLRLVTTEPKFDYKLMLRLHCIWNISMYIFIIKVFEVCQRRTCLLIYGFIRIVF